MPSVLKSLLAAIAVAAAVLGAPPAALAARACAGCNVAVAATNVRTVYKTKVVYQAREVTRVRHVTRNHYVHRSVHAQPARFYPGDHHAYVRPVNGYGFSYSHGYVRYDRHGHWHTGQGRYGQGYGDYGHRWARW